MCSNNITSMIVIKNKNKQIQITKTVNYVVWKLKENDFHFKSYWDFYFQMF